MIRPLPNAALLLGAALLAGCVATPRATSPVAVDSLAFSTSGHAPVPDAWWRAFDDPGLDATVEAALTGNFTVQAAFARLEAARALTRRTRAPLFPTVEAEAGANLSTDGPLGGGTRPPLDLGLGVSWEIDLWGRVRSAVDAQQQRALATREDARAAALSLSAEVARTWVAIAATREQIALLDAQIDTNQSLVEVVQARVLHGIQGPADLFRQDRLQEQTRAQRIQRLADLEVLEHRLSVLLGRPPQEPPERLPAALPALPPLPAAGVPSELLQRRPDLRAAAHMLQATDAEVASAVADQFPRLTLTADVFNAPTSGRALLTGWVASLGANLLATLFAGGERRAEIRRRRALVEEALADYGDAVLVALQEVEDTLTRDRAQQELVANIDRQVALAEQTVDSLTARYTGGLDVGFLDVVTAQGTAQQLGRDQIAARQQHLLVRITLYRALAGGVEPTQDPE